MQGFATREVVVGHVGQLCEDGERADQDRDVGHVQPLHPLGEQQVGLAVPMLAHRVPADVLDPLIAAATMLLRDDFAQQPSEEANAGAACRSGAASEVGQGFRLGQGGHRSPIQRVWISVTPQSRARCSKWRRWPQLQLRCLLGRRRSAASAMEGG